MADPLDSCRLSRARVRLSKAPCRAKAPSGDARQLTALSPLAASTLASRAAVNWSVIRILISLPRSAPKMAACLRAPPAIPTARGTRLKVSRSIPITRLPAGIPDFASARIVEAQTNVSDRAATADLLEFLRRKDVPAARHQRGRLDRTNPHKRNRQLAEQARGLLDVGILQENIHRTRRADNSGRRKKTRLAIDKARKAGHQMIRMRFRRGIAQPTQAPEPPGSLRSSGRDASDPPSPATTHSRTTPRSPPPKLASSSKNMLPPRRSPPESIRRCRYATPPTIAWANPNFLSKHVLQLDERPGRADHRRPHDLIVLRPLQEPRHRHLRDPQPLRNVRLGELLLMVKCGHLRD